MRFDSALLQLSSLRRTIGPLFIALLLQTHISFGVEVVCNPDVSIDAVSLRQLQAIFTMRQRAWPDGVPVRVFVLADHDPLQMEFAKTQLDLFPYILRRYWDRLVFSGTGQAPIEVSSLREMQSRISETPGAIGFLPPDLVDSRVRVLKVGSP